MAKFRGLVFVKHGRVGSRSEGPDYFLQTYKGDFSLQYQQRNLWQPDYQLEYYGRRMVEVEGELSEPRTIKVARITEILSPRIPQPGLDEPHLGDPFDLAYGHEARLADAGLTLKFLAVEQDSRCPIGVVCVWEGQCVVSLSLAKDGGEAHKFTLTSRGGHPEGAAADVLGYRVELHGVRPAPTKDIPQPKHELYVLNLEINAIA